MKLDTFPKFFIALIIIVVLGVSFASCYSEKKAGSQITKALNEYPDTAASLIRARFPCISGPPDSTKFLLGIDTLKQILRETNKRANDYSRRLKLMHDSLRAAQKASGDDCSTLLTQATDYIAESNIEKDSLKMALIDAQAQRKKALDYVKTIKPVEKLVRDSAEVLIAYRDRERMAMEAAGWKIRYDQDHEWRVKQEKRMSGAWTVYIPWWLIGLLAALACLSLAARIKTGLLNPLALFTKKHK